MLDPEIPYGLILVGKRIVVIRFFVGEEGAVEIKSDPLFLCPVNPALEILNFDLIPVDISPLEIAITGVRVQSLLNIQVIVSMMLLTGDSAKGVSVSSLSFKIL